MATTLESLLRTMTKEQMIALLLAYYQKQGFETSAWQDFGVDLTRTEAFSSALVDTVTNQIPAIAGGSLLDYAPNYPGWTALTARQIWNLSQLSATFTNGNVTFVNASGTVYTFSPTNPVTVAFASSGKRYKSTGSGTIPANGSLANVPMQAEFAGASYVDPSNSGDISIVSPSMPGVTVTNPSTPFTSVTHTGSGTGTVALSGSPTIPHSVVVSVMATSAAGPPTVSYSLDGTAAVSLGAVSSVTNLAGTGINLTFNDGTGTSWVDGDTYQFSTPASWITSQGADAQSDSSLVNDCRNRWATVRIVDTEDTETNEDRLAPPTKGFYELLAKRTPNVGAQVTQAFAVPDTVINNKVNIIVAGPGGVLPSTTIQTIQNWITPWARGCDIPVVQSPTTTPLTIAATIKASATQLTQTQSAVQTALLDYIAGIPVNGTVELGEIIAIIRTTTGVTGLVVSSVLINNAAADLVLGSTTTFVLPAYPPTLSLSWVTQ